MDISIVIVSYNTKEILSECLDSIKDYSKNIKCETFVVDNNSQDYSTVLIERKYPWVKLIANKENLGFSKANNLALKKVTGKYVLILNPDTKLTPDTLSKMKEYMDKSEDSVGIATCRVELLTGELDRDCRRMFPTPARALTHFSGLSKLFKGSRLFDQYYCGYLKENKEHEIDACVGAFMFIKSAVLKKIGHFDEDFFFYGEDLDLCYRAKAAGYKIMYTPTTKIIHYKGVSSGIKKHSKHLSTATKETKKRIIKESTRAMDLFYKKHYKQKYPFFITLPVLLGIQIVENLRLFKIEA